MVGAGSVGRRKIAGLVDREPTEVLVVDPAGPGGDMDELLSRPEVRFEKRPFRDEDLEGRFLVIASTDNEELNWRISDICRERGILCNIVDQPEKCSFIVPAIIRQGDLTLAVSTGGASPALAKKLKRELEEYIGPHYGSFLMLMARLRPLVIGLDKGTEHNTAVFKRLVASDLMEAVAARDEERARVILAENLPEELAEETAELTHGLF